MASKLLDLGIRNIQVMLEIKLLAMVYEINCAARGLFVVAKMRVSITSGLLLWNITRT